jgi:transcriptional regulator with XRE-family HTH domain
MMNNIKNAREKKRMSQKEISVSLGVSAPTVSDWENGKKSPAAKNLLALSKLLECSTDYLLGNTDDPAPLLVISDTLKQVQVGFDRGEFEGLSQKEVDRLAEYAEFIKAQRAKKGSVSRDKT